MRQCPTPPGEDTNHTAVLSLCLYFSLLLILISPGRGGGSDAGGCRRHVGQRATLTGKDANPHQRIMLSSLLLDAVLPGCGGCPNTVVRRRNVGHRAIAQCQWVRASPHVFPLPNAPATAGRKMYQLCSATAAANLSPGGAAGRCLPVQIHADHQAPAHLCMWPSQEDVRPVLWRAPVWLLGGPAGRWARHLPGRGHRPERPLRAAAQGKKLYSIAFLSSE